MFVKAAAKVTFFAAAFFVDAGTSGKFLDIFRS